MRKEIKNRQGERLDYEFTACKPNRSLTWILGHGVTANKDRKWALVLEEILAEAGFGVLRFSFSGNGESEGDFRESTISKEVQDLAAVTEALRSQDIGALAYAGHSMGGAVGVLYALKDSELKALVSLAGMVHTKDFADRKFGDLTPGQDVMWDKPECPLSQTFLDDMEALHSVLPYASKIKQPWLLVHGADDSVVPYQESVEIQQAQSSAELIVLEDADHLFTDQEELMARHVTAFAESLPHQA